MNKRAIIYARVSTDEQAEKGHSLPFQIEECRSYAGRKGLLVVREIKDNKSGSSLDRPGFMEMETMLANGEAQAVVTYTSDRLCRNYYDYVPLIGRWQEKNIELHFVDRGGKTQNDLQGMISDGIFAMIAHTERLKILERTKNGRLKKAKDDQRPVMTGNVPYGYGRIGRLQDAEMVIDPDEAEIVKMVFNWYTLPDDGGPLSLLAISNRLDSMGIRPRSAKIWHPTSVRLILTNETYVGRMHYAKTQILKDGRQVPRPKDEWIAIEIPQMAIIDRETFEAAQIRLKHNKDFSKRNRKHDYLLVGHIRCAFCGFAMYGFRKREGARPYYRCASYNNKQATCEYKHRSIPMGSADARVWEWLYNIISDDVVLSEGIRAMVEMREQEIQPRRERLEYIERLLVSSDEKIRRLIDELADFTGETVKAAIKEKVTQIETEKELLSEERNRLIGELDQSVISEDLERRMMTTAARLRRHITNPTIAEMRELLSFLDVKVVYYDMGNNTKKLKVSCFIPDSEEDIVFSSS